ncbi:hypothetical protein EC973_003956 [Apophysomyces ossiformis]|uniref:Agmatinase n=1 Tax=Apophysomyces ossiformis TaxID=679940 RepID=A0A8H7BLV1_9FUNG|nr:hypothetical protein EC973_003956 [Apophysomyces ossiformis]
MKIIASAIVSLAAVALAHPLYGDHDIRNQQQQLFDAREQSQIWPLPTADDGLFAGIGTFAHLPYEQCWKNTSVQYDIAFLGAPMDTSVSFRPGARFGPSGIREASRRTILSGGYNVPMAVNPFMSWAKIVDCGDIFVTPFDNERAVSRIHQDYKALLDRTPATEHAGAFPRLITMGGDHTITLPILRAIHAAYGPVSVIHFDSHLDTWSPYAPGEEEPNLNHGTYFYFASEEGLIKKNESVHGGIRCPIFSPADYKQDFDLGFRIIEARDIDTIGVKGIIDRIRKIVGNNPVYLSIDIDTLDPAYAPATGTPETGGWTTREFRRIIRGLEGLKIVGADLVEVAPAYDTNAQLTTLAAADLLFDVLSLMVKAPLKHLAPDHQ